MPMHGPQAHSSRRAPLARMSVSAPQPDSISSTCREPGETDRLTPSATFLPLRIAATRSRSRSEEFVQEPMQTWLTATSSSSLAGRTLSGECGQAHSGSTAERSMSITRS